MSDQAYTIEFTCDNCMHVFEKEVPFGTRAAGSGGQCPYCGVLDSGRFRYDKLLRISYMEGMRNLNYNGRSED